ncbi:MAG TPA: SusC/RagA family TonB-linked outer membrane protein [Candidatus Avibacteroides faecavium]|nr:SusC/RagA family TonB-linked outer membrane protein [Candidatus Avibacteroides faecavium]
MGGGITLFCLALLGAGNSLYANNAQSRVQSVLEVKQSDSIEGTVVDAKGEPIIGANIVVVGTPNGTITDFNGNFVLTGVPAGATVEVSYIGYKTVTFAVDGRDSYSVKLQEDSEMLGEVVVTAMGIERQSETLTYSAQTVGGKDVNELKSVNMINALQGKSAGLTITPNSTGAGGSSKIQFRGSKSISGSNRPLVVVDGVPLMMDLTTQQVDSNYGGQRDGGDAMSTINPDDIASITLLKGASAAALYGAVAANGAIMITTKSASSGKVAVNFSSNTTVETPMVLPKFQNSYGMSEGLYSWGSKLGSEAPNYAKDFYQVGVTTNNSISLSGGTEKIQAYFSYQNVWSRGITPENDFMSHNFNSKVGFNPWKNVHIDFTAKYTNQQVDNQPAAGYLFNPLTGVYLFPRGENWDGYKENYEVWDESRGVSVQNWVNNKQEQFGNPYWILNRQKQEVDRNRYEFGGNVTWDITSDWKVQGRLKYERADERWKHNLHASSVADRYPMGRMKDNRYFSDQLYGDVLLSYNHTWGDYSLSVTAGSSFTKNTTSHVDLWAEGQKFTVNNGVVSGNVYYPNIFTPNNYYANMSSLSDGDWETEKRLNSVFATAQFGFREGLFIDASVRNDWSSTLAFTDKCSFAYPSVGASLLLDKFVDMGSNVDLFKVRASYSMVGNDVPVYITNRLYRIGTQGTLTPPEEAPFKTMEPEQTTSIEAGFDGTFFQNRFNVSLTYYKTNTRNQYFVVSSPFETGLRNRYVNAGNVQNQGFEASLGWFQPFNDDFSWQTDVNLSFNDNKIVELVDGLPNGLTLSDFGGAKIILKEGGEYGDLYVRHMVYEDGKPQITADGKPVISGDPTADEEFYVGNMNSKWNLSWNNTFRYKDFTLSFLIDGRIGGKVLSMTEATMDGWGVSERTGEARDNGGTVTVDGVTFDAQKYYTTVGSTSYNTAYDNSQYVYNATNFRLRELSLGYTFRNLLGTGNHLTLSLIGRNLFFFYKDAPMDPDVSIGTGNGMQGIDIFSLPTSRSFGLNIKLNF